MPFRGSPTGDLRCIAASAIGHQIPTTNAAFSSPMLISLTRAAAKFIARQHFGKFRAARDIISGFEAPRAASIRRGSCAWAHRASKPIYSVLDMLARRPIFSRFHYQHAACMPTEEDFRPASIIHITSALSAPPARQSTASISYFRRHLPPCRPADAQESSPRLVRAPH